MKRKIKYILIYFYKIILKLVKLSFYFFVFLSIIEIQKNKKGFKMKKIFLSILIFIGFSSSLMAENPIDRFCKKYTDGYNIGYMAKNVVFLTMNESATEIVIKYKEHYRKKQTVKIVSTTHKKSTLSYYKKQFKVYSYITNKKGDKIGFKDTLFICRKAKNGSLKNAIAFFKPKKPKK